MPSASRVLRCGRVGNILRGALVIELGLLGPALLGWDEAQARPEYNQALLEALDAQLEADGQPALECTNASTCFFCHTSGVPQSVGTAGTEFFGVLLAAGHDRLMPGTAAMALETLRMDATDTNGDGTTDWEHMVEFSNPNQVLGAAGAGAAGAAGAGAVVTEKEFGTCDGARYGCGARIAPPSETSSLSLFGVAAVLLGVLGVAAQRRR